MNNAKSLLLANKCSAIYSISNIEANSERSQREVNDELVSEISKFVSRSGRVEVNRLDYTTEYRLSVYVLSPEDLYRIINEEAMRLSGMISRNMNSPRFEP